MLSPEVFRSAGTLPTGPVSAWPKARHDSLMEASQAKKKATKVKATKGEMLRSGLQVAAMGAQNGTVSPAVRNARYETCQACPYFLADSKRCSECGCFMEAKTWINGNPDHLCPKQLWAE